MSFLEWALVIYSILCTVALINSEFELQRLSEYFESYRKMTDVIEERMKNEIEKLKKES